MQLKETLSASTTRSGWYGICLRVHLLRSYNNPMPKKILIVDDEPQIVEICRDYLKAAGYDTVTANNGVQGVSLARREKPDLIVLDLMMPEMDGLDVTRAIRRESDVPIIMLTARPRW